MKNPVASDSFRPAAYDNNYYFTQPASFDGNTVSVVLSPDSGTDKNNAANVVDNDNRTRGIIQKQRIPVSALISWIRTGKKLL